MDNKLLLLFKMFSIKKIDIYELQKGLSTIQCDNYEEEEQIRILDNKLEEIIFCNNVENYYKNVMKVIQSYYADI